MQKTIFITLEGGVIQKISATNDIVNETNVVVLDFDTDGIEDYKLSLVNGNHGVVYRHQLHPIDDGDIDFIETLVGEG